VTVAQGSEVVDGLPQQETVMGVPPQNPRDVDFTEIEAILRVHKHPPYGAYIEVVMGHVLDPNYLVGWREGALT